jgi:hypothetical protein
LAEEFLPIEAVSWQLPAQDTVILNSRHSAQGNLEIERLHLQALPHERFADYVLVAVRVRISSTIKVREITYSDPHG